MCLASEDIKQNGINLMDFICHEYNVGVGCGERHVCVCVRVCDVCVGGRGSARVCVCVCVCVMCSSGVRV